MSVTDYLTSIVWDGTPRLERWLIDCAGAEDMEDVRSAGREMLIAAVRRARSPGCRSDQLLVVDGPAGCCKSGALQVLAVESSWYGCIDVNAINDARRLRENTEGKWLVEISLEAPFRKIVDAEALKVFLAQAHDEQRLLYGHKKSYIPRSFIAVGTTCISAEEDYPGVYFSSRRFSRIRVQPFNLELLRGIRDQLWAEAVVVEEGRQPAHLRSVAAAL